MCPRCATYTDTFAGWVGQLVHVNGVRTFIGLYPQGEEVDGITGWQTGHRGLQFDEGAFFAAIVAKLRALGSTGRFYVWGYSNGAAMAHKLAVNGGLGFRGIAATATALTAAPETYGDGLLAYNFPTTDSATEPLAVLSVMGSTDRTIPLRGGAFTGTDAILADAKDSILLWSEINQCTGQATAALDATYRDSEREEVSGSATRTVFEGCLLPTQYIEVSCAGHSGAQSIDGQDSMSYAIAFLLGVDATCDASGGLCEALTEWTPQTPTTWPDYTLPPTCEDTDTSCTCPTSFEVTAGEISFHPLQPPGPPPAGGGSAGTDSSFVTSYSGGSLEIQGYTPAACTTATPCQLYVFLTGTGMSIIEPELMFLREMGARGFVSGFVMYPQVPYYPQDNDQWADKAQVVWQGDSSALAVLCARTAVDCDLGIAVHGFSHGGGIAALAAQYDSRVVAALLFGIGTCVRSESECAQGNGVSSILQASSQVAYLADNVRGVSRGGQLGAQLFLPHVWIILRVMPVHLCAPADAAFLTVACIVCAEAATHCGR